MCSHSRHYETVCFHPAETSETEVQAVLIDCSRVVFVDVAGARLFTQVGLQQKDMVPPSWFGHVMWFSSCRCAPSARKLEFVSIWQIAMVSLFNVRYFSHTFFFLLCCSIGWVKCVKCVWIYLVPFRECLKDLDIKRPDESHESSAYFHHRSRCRNVHSATEGTNSNRFQYNQRINYFHI